MYLKRNDLVVVISGVHRGKQGRVLRIERRRADKKKGDRGQELVYVQGLNLVFKHIRRNQKNPQGGRIQKEAPFPICKLQLVDPKTNRPTRAGFRSEDGRKVRYSKRSGEPI
jgi:large subunit ribosomal protein L24